MEKLPPPPRLPTIDWTEADLLDTVLFRRFCRALKGERLIEEKETIAK